jgi:hypothetical protein
MTRGAQRTPAHPGQLPYAADGGSNFYGVAPTSGINPTDYGGSPPEGNTNYITAPGGIGWAPSLIDQPGGTPDPQRIEELPRTDRRANLRNPFAWWRKLDEDTSQRESATSTQAIGFTETKGQRTRAPDPRWTPPNESRLTQQMSPHTYIFTRPFDQTIARRLNGQHVSLADNRRQYEILTMRPVTMRRNTYRVEPTPWDTDIVDQPINATEGRPQARLSAPDIPPNPRSAYRL